MQQYRQQLGRSPLRSSQTHSKELTRTKDMKMIYSSESEEQLNGYSCADWGNDQKYQAILTGYAIKHSTGAVARCTELLKTTHSSTTAAVI